MGDATPLLLSRKVSNAIANTRRSKAQIIFPDDKDSIELLAQETARCFDHEKVRMFYIAAQVRCIDLKVDLAVNKTMQIYKRILKSALSVTAIPLGSTTNHVSVAVVVCKAVVNAFGVPSVTATTVQQIIKNIVWDGTSIGRSFSVLTAECIATVGLFGTLVFGGMPLFLAAGALNVPIVIPATAQLLLMLSCDAILILVKAFKNCTHQCLGQPLKKDIENAATEYRRFATQVHQEIKDLTSNFNIVKNFQVAKIHVGVQKVLEKYTKLFVEDSEVGASRLASGDGSKYSLVSSIEVEKAQKSW